MTKSLNHDSLLKQLWDIKTFIIRLSKDEEVSLKSLSLKTDLKLSEISVDFDLIGKNAFNLKDLIGKRQ